MITDWLDPVSYKLGQAAGGGGNPNYVETISGTVANPWGAANYLELIDGISSNELTVAMTIGGTSLNASVINGILFSMALFDLPEGTEPYQGASVFYSILNEGALTIAKANFGTGSGWGDLPSATPTTLTIIHHPLP